ncbi:hypothetical protein Gasu2_26810 [Galdieria sulphuraria]|uniref:DUF7803 domain-containing protein n=1 Tax=Galdieria sulphuraria TaxID=130081 RepID=M2Y316_GALSU|nr:uncharacterized protein Gasu_23650 [Galdieria sulphuraria]EME30209.1 hypothetical protein Gasu_23650 [Galdieria sulphuraria]GJD08375.1 hypothetical protein Gasu2_26810 [Galdieria sulphuraria]|eukprot:XP_005706729.1 hypothetical protein Gasu_23650 [Galdieria sulphuraria]
MSEAKDNFRSNLFTQSSALVRQPPPELPKELPKDFLKDLNLCEKHLANVFRCFLLFSEEKRCRIQMTIYRKCKERRDKAIRERVWEWDEGYFRSLNSRSRQALLGELQKELEKRQELLERARERNNKLGAIHVESRISDLQRRLEHLKQFV